MNYTYDIYINLNTSLYDFFDWNKSDKIMRIKKIPIYRTNENNILKLIQYNIKISDDFLNKMYNKTQLWNKETNLEYCALFCNENNAIAIEFNSNGLSIRKSYLPIDEELDILETVIKINEQDINFEILNKCVNLTNTRNELNQKKFITRELNNIEESRLNYICLECFGKHEKSKKIILKKINKLPNTSKIYENLYNILKLTSTTKK